MARPAGKVDPELTRALRELRTERNLTREAVAHGAKVTLSTIASIEQGKSNPTWTTVRQIVDALGASMRELIERIEA
jgi:transcriptional regulator with XRE-family HTH domain